MPCNILLIGFSATGKSKVARLLAGHLGWQAVDTDELIVARTGRSIPDIFREDGEAVFRDLEAAALAEALAGDYRAVATGGGAVLRAENRALMRARGRVVLLEARPETILARLREAAAGEPRPLLAGGDPLDRIRTLKAARQLLYDGLADVIVDTEGQTEAEVAQAVVAALDLHTDTQSSAGGNTMLHDVVIKELAGHADERQVFREIIRSTDDFFAEGFGQLSYACMNPGTAKAWHIHRKQVDWWYVPIGALKLVLHDLRPDSPTYRQTQEILLGPDYGHRVVRIPPGVAHGLKVIGGVTHLFYVTSRVYDPTDEGRIPHDDAGIGYDWTALPPIK